MEIDRKIVIVVLFFVALAFALFYKGGVFKNSVNNENILFQVIPYRNCHIENEFLVCNITSSGSCRYRWDWETRKYGFFIGLDGHGLDAKELRGVIDDVIKAHAKLWQDNHVIFDGNLPLSSWDDRRHYTHFKYKLSDGYLSVRMYVYVSHTNPPLGCETFYDSRNDVANLYNDHFKNPYYVEIRIQLCPADEKIVVSNGKIYCAECYTDQDCIDKYKNCDYYCEDGRCIAKTVTHPPKTCPDGSIVKWIGYPTCDYEECPEIPEEEEVQPTPTPQPINWRATIIGIVVIVLIAGAVWYLRRR